MASLVLPVAPVPCTQHLRCARSITSLAVRHQGVSVIRLASRLMKSTRISPAATRQNGHHGNLRQVPPGGPHLLCLWRLCLVPGFSAARVR